jgi:hypothetical protein
MAELAHLLTELDVTRKPILHRRNLNSAQLETKRETWISCTDRRTDRRKASAGALCEIAIKSGGP